MRVRAVQFKARKGDVPSSLRALSLLADRAAQGADLVVLPEMAATGYLFDGPVAAGAVAEPARGATFAALARVAAARRCWVVAGFPERAGDRLFNSALVIDPSGALAFCYRKTLLYGADVPWASPGDSGYRRIDTDAGSFGVGICMDLNDDRFVAWCAGASLDVVALPTNWVEEGDDVWSYWAWRLRATPSALVAANTWGDETLAGATTTFSGASAILQAQTVLAAAPKVGDGFISADLAPGARPPETA